jgi:hypothetical protein
LPAWHGMHTASVVAPAPKLARTMSEHGTNTCARFPFATHSFMIIYAETKHRTSANKSNTRPDPNPRFHSQPSLAAVRKRNTASLLVCPSPCLICFSSPERLKPSSPYPPHFTRFASLWNASRGASTHRIPRSMIQRHSTCMRRSLRSDKRGSKGVTRSYTSLRPYGRMVRQASFIKPLMVEQRRHVSCVGDGGNLPSHKTGPRFRLNQLG